MNPRRLRHVFVMLVLLLPAGSRAMVADASRAGPRAQAERPARRAHHSMVYDASSRRVLLAGGSTSNDGGKTYSTFDDLWAFDGRRWRALGPSGVRRSGMALAFDSRRGRVLAFGGYCPCKTTDGGRYDDLLELRDGQWHVIGQIAGRPSTDSRMIYDARRDRLVLFGGRGAGRQLHVDTWEYDGATWRRVDVTGPELRGDVAMTYDGKRGRTIVVGESGGTTGPASAATWVYDGRAWGRIATDGPPLPPTPSAVYDATRDRVLLLGGDSTLWSWDGRVWTRVATDGPPKRYFGAMVYDVARDRVVMFGGRPGLPESDANDTWEWDGSRWIEIR